MNTKLPDQIGYLLLHETGPIISSSGDLENDENTAEIIYNLASISDKLDSKEFPDGFNKISIYFKGICYIICLSNKKLHVVKRKLTVDMNSSNPPEGQLIDLQIPVNNSINA